MQAIRTTWLRMTEARGQRVMAAAAAGSIILDWDSDLPRAHETNHRVAAEALVAKLGWNTDGYGTLVTGCLPDGSYCHVLTGRDGKGG